MARTLVIGYGNPSRNDDGVGLAVVNHLRQRLGLKTLDETTDGFDDLGGGLDTLFLQQLTPELAETVAAYDRLILVDAHTGAYPDLVHQTQLSPRHDPAMVSHVLKPDHLLALAQQFCGRSPRAELISVRGFDFNFGETLSQQTAQGVAQVVQHIWDSVAVRPS
ncbi:MAG: hydrogenase maturation protease [Chloroflexota bacterium]|nr:hydrogenase maturation protease [Chloroflexota bacterium]